MPRRARYPSHVQAALDQAVELQDRRPRAAAIRLVLPYPPSVNALYRSFVTPSGRVVVTKTKQGKAYANAVARTVGLWLNHHGVRPPIPPYRLEIHAYPPNDGRRHDVDNLLKASVDGLFEAISADDDDIIDLRITKPRPGEPHRFDPGLAVTLEGDA